MPIQKLPEYLAGLRDVAREEGRDVFQAAAKILGEAFGIQGDHLGKSIEFR